MNQTLTPKEQPTARLPETSFEGVIPTEGVIDVESPELPVEIKRQVSDRGIEAMREVFRGLEDYAIFASTARYLHGWEKGIEELQAPPGDLDVVVFDERLLDQLRERLTRVPGIEFRNVEPTADDLKQDKEYLNQDDLAAGRRPEFKRLPFEPVKILQGRLVMEVTTELGKRQFGYPFEIFAHSRVINQELKKYREPVAGLQTLSLEGLQKQYGRNLELESRVLDQVIEMRRWLMKPKVRSIIDQELIRKEAFGKQQATLGIKGEFPVDPGIQKILDQTGLDFNDLEKFYRLEKSFAEFPPRSKAEQDLVEQAFSKLLSGLKTKVAKREESVAQLKKATRLDVEDSTQYESASAA